MHRAKVRSSPSPVSVLLQAPTRNDRSGLPRGADRDCTYFKELPVRESASFAAGSADAPADPATVLLEVRPQLTAARMS